MAGDNPTSAPIVPGLRAERSFTIDSGAMADFARLSGDTSAVHTDPTFAQSRGFKDVIVYGGLMLAQLSGALGGLLPGDEGVSARWSIDFRSPLYLDEPATLLLEVAHVSGAVGLVDLRFSIRAGDRLVASGTAQSLVPPERISA